MSMENMSLAQLAEQEERLKQYRLDVQNKVSSTMDIIRDNKYAMLALCKQDGFCQTLRESFGISADVPNDALYKAIRKQLFAGQNEAVKLYERGEVDIKDVFRGRRIDSARTSSPEQEKPVRRTTAYKPVTFQVSGQSITGKAYSFKDKDWTEYRWMSMYEYISFVRDIVDTCGKKKSTPWAGSFAVRYMPTGEFQSHDWLNMNYGAMKSNYYVLCDLSKQENVTNVIDAKSLMSVEVFQVLAHILYAMFKDRYVQELADLLVKSRAGEPGADPIIKAFLLFKSEFPQSRKRYDYVVLPGTGNVNGVADEVAINNVNLRELKDKLGSTAVYTSFNNEAFYCEFFEMLVMRLLPDTDPQQVEQLLNSEISFLVKPGKVVS